MSTSRTLVVISDYCFKVYQVFELFTMEGILSTLLVSQLMWENTDLEK